MKRHYQKRSPEETDELMDAVAGTVVEFIKAGGKVPTTEKKKEAGSQAHEPDAPANEPG